MAEYRDNDTGLHIIRMSEDELELLLNASPMHDIGKIGIPDNILLKPGKLNDEEWAVMQSMHKSELIFYQVMIQS